MEQLVDISSAQVEPTPLQEPRAFGRNRAPKRKSAIRRRLERGLEVHVQSRPLNPSWSLPDWFAGWPLLTYMLSIAFVYVRFFDRGAEWYFVVFGFMWVYVFFYLSKHLSLIWNIRHIHSSDIFAKQIFWGALGVRVVYVVISYYFYLGLTGRPFEFQAADSLGYTEMAQDYAHYLKTDKLWQVLVDNSMNGVSDMGYPIFLFLFYAIFDADAAIFMIRFAQSILGAYTAVLIYRMARRSMDENTARLASIFCALHPVLICYTGMSLKEVVMTCLLTLFIERADKVLRNHNFSFGTIFPVVIIGMFLFFFRTVLGMVAFMAVATAILMMDSKIISKGRKIVIGSIMGVFLFSFASDRIMREVHQIVETDVIADQKHSLEYRFGAGKAGGRGNAYAKYAGAAVFAPLIFTIPFPTMIYVEGQDDMRLIHGGNWVRNVLSGLVILAMVLLLLSGDWRNYTLPLAMMLGYLLVLVFSAFAQSLRFHIPIIPFEMMFASYAFTRIGHKHRNWYTYWCVCVVVFCLAWNWFKLAGRGLA